MLVEQTIINKINNEFSPIVLNIENESYMHSSGRGDESHFKLTLVSDKFEGKKSRCPSSGSLRLFGGRIGKWRSRIGSPFIHTK